MLRWPPPQPRRVTGLSSVWLKNSLKTAVRSCTPTASMSPRLREGMPAAMVRRLVFSQKHVESRIQALGKIAGLPDPLGVLEGYRQLPNGLWAGKMCVPIGVVAFVYDAWPHTTLNAAALCLKAGNPCILKGNKETRCTNQALQRIMERALHTAGLPVRAVQLVSHVEQDWMPSSSPMRELT